MIVETPKCLAMVLCDQIYRDPVSRKLSCLGMFHELTVLDFPFELQFAIYVAMTGGRGPNNLKVRMVPADMLLEGAQAGVWVDLPAWEIKDPLVLIEGTLMASCVCKCPGQHLFELYAQDELLMTRRLTIHHASPHTSS